MYVYKITNLINGKIYIGLSTVNTQYNRKNYYGSGILIKKALKKYGKSSFTKEIIFETNELEDLQRFEKEIIYEYQDKFELYNVAEGGQTGHWTQFKSEEELKDIRDRQRQSLIEYYKEHDSPTKGMKFEYGPKISEALKGKKQSPEVVQKRNRANTGKRRTCEQKENISNAIKEAYSNGFTEQHRASLSESLTGRNLSESHKEKLRKPKPLMICPQCGKKGKGPVMYRHHFDNCKLPITEL